MRGGLASGASFRKMRKSEIFGLAKSRMSTLRRVTLVISE